MTMTKQEVKDLCEDDPHLQWWAMVLFAEIVDLANSDHGGSDQVLAKYVRDKVAEFPILIIQRAHEKAKERVAANQQQGQL